MRWNEVSDVNAPFPYIGLRAVYTGSVYRALRWRADADGAAYRWTSAYASSIDLHCVALRRLTADDRQVNVVKHLSVVLYENLGNNVDQRASDRRATLSTFVTIGRHVVVFVESVSSRPSDCLVVHPASSCGKKTNTGCVNKKTPTYFCPQLRHK